MPLSTRCAPHNEPIYRLIVRTAKKGKKASKERERENKIRIPGYIK